MSTPTANSILMGGGGLFASFKAHGDTLVGTVIDVGEPYQAREWNNLTQRADGPPKFTKAGKPVWAFHVTLSTDERDPAKTEDDGTRVLDVNSWRMQDALRTAIKGAGAEGLEVGARVQLTYTHDEVPGDNRSGKHFTAAYTRPANVALMGDTGGQPVAAPTPVSAPAAAPASAPAPAPVAAPPAAAPVAAESPAVKAKALAALGLTPEQIAPQLGLDPTVVAILIAA